MGGVASEDSGGREGDGDVAMLGGLRVGQRAHYRAHERCRNLPPCEAETFHALLDRAVAPRLEFETADGDDRLDEFGS